MCYSFLFFRFPVGHLLLVHHDFTTPAYGPDDVRWIGNWWLMYPLMGLLTCIVSTIMACLPKGAPQQMASPKTDTLLYNNNCDNNNNDNNKDTDERKDFKSERKISKVESIKQGGTNLLGALRSIFRLVIYRKKLYSVLL